MTTLPVPSQAGAVGLTQATDLPASRNPFPLLRRPALILNANSSRVEAARQKAETEPYIAAEGLARLVLLERDKLDATRSEQMLADGLGEILGAPR